jgi:hypothetical protein
MKEAQFEMCVYIGVWCGGMLGGGEGRQSLTIYYAGFRSCPLTGIIVLAACMISVRQLSITKRRRFLRARGSQFMSFLNIATSTKLLAIFRSTPVILVISGIGNIESSKQSHKEFLQAATSHTETVNSQESYSHPWGETQRPPSSATSPRRPSTRRRATAPSALPAVPSGSSTTRW